MFDLFNNSNSLISTFTDQFVYTSMKSSGIFLNNSEDITQDLILQIQKVINPTYKPTICMPYEIEQSDNYCVLKFPLYLPDTGSICPTKSEGNEFDYYVYILILHPLFTQINSSWGLLNKFIVDNKLTGFDNLINQFPSTEDKSTYEFLLKFTENTQSEGLLTFSYPFVVKLNGIEYYFVSQCNAFKSNSGKDTFKIEYGWNQNTNKVPDTNTSFQTIYTNNEYNYDSGLSDIISLSNYTLNGSDCFNLKNKNWTSGNFNTKTSFGFLTNNKGCYFPKYTEQTYYLYADSILHDKTSFDFNTDLSVDNSLYFPVPDKIGGYKFMQIVNNDNIFLDTTESLNLKQLSGQNYYYNTSSGPVSIQGDIINRSLQFGSDGSNNNTYVKLSDSTYYKLSDFINGYNSAGEWAAKEKITNISGLNIGLNDSYFYTLINCKKNNDDGCTFNIDNNPFYNVSFSNTGTFDSNGKYLGLSNITSLFNSDNNWKNQGVQLSRSSQKSDPNYLSATTNWETSNNVLFSNQFYTRLTDSSFNVDNFCQSNGDTSATGSAGTQTIFTSFDNHLNSFLQCSPSPRTTNQAGPSDKPNPVMWWQNCDPDDGSSCIYDHLGGGNPDYQIKLATDQVKGWYKLADSQGTQIAGTRPLNEVYKQLNNGKNGSCPYHEKNILTKMSQIQTNTDGDYISDDIYRCMYRGTPYNLYGTQTSNVDNNYPALDCNYPDYELGVSGITNSPFLLMAPLSFKPDTNDPKHFSVDKSWSSTVGSGKSFVNGDTYPFYYSTNNETQEPQSGNGMGLRITVKNTEATDCILSLYNISGYHDDVKIPAGEVYQFVITPIVNAPPNNVCKISDSDTAFSSGSLSKSFSYTTNTCSGRNFTKDSLPQNWCLNINDPFLDRSTTELLPQFYFILTWGSIKYYVIYDLGVKENIANDTSPFATSNSCWFNDPNPSDWIINNSQGTYIYGSQNACRTNVQTQNVIRFNFNISNSENTIFEINNTNLSNNRIGISLPQNCVTHVSGSDPQILSPCDNPTIGTGVVKGCGNCKCNKLENGQTGIDMNHLCSPTLFYSIE